VGAAGAISLGGAKVRALLALLAVHVGEAVAEDRLIDALWGEAAPRTATKTLRSYVSRLRAALAPSEGRLVVDTTPGGYRLRAAEDTLDVARVEGLAAQAREASERGDHAWSAVALTEALRTWRGSPLGEFGGETWAAAEAIRLAELRQSLLEARIDADLACGRHASLVPELDALTAEHPLREKLWGQRMVALYRSGRQADALRVYQELRTILADELGIDPSHELKQLEQQVLEQDHALDWQADAGAPSGAATATPTALPSGVVTFLLTDIEGSAELWDDAPDAMADALARHDTLIRSALDPHGGVLLKARGEGDSTFSVFARATDAVAAARVIRQTLTAEAWPAAAQIRVRIALHTGEALERDGDYYGPAVNRVARLRELAAGDEILVSSTTAAVVMDHLPAGCVLFERGLQELRGLSRPETVYVLAVPSVSSPAHAEAGAVPLPARVAAPPFTGFHGRIAERELLARRLKAAAGGERSVVFLAGEPGIGKTSLAAEAARAAYETGAVVLYGRCDEDLGIPYQPWIEALAHLAEHMADQLVDGLDGRRLADLSRLVPSLADRISEPVAAVADAEAERYLLFGAVGAALAVAGEQTPVMLVLDDLHWADVQTLALLRHVLSAPQSVPLMVVATYRDTEVSAQHPLADTLAVLHREVTLERLALAGLEDNELVALVEAASGQELEGAELELVHAVYGETDGNPFFAWELMRHLIDTGAVTRDDAGRWTVQADLDPAALPDSVREVIGRRVARLGDDVQQTLTLAAVLGREFELELLTHALDADADDVLEQLEQAETVGLITSSSPGRFSFVHALVGHTLVADLSPTRRARAHRRIAEALEALGDPDAHLAELARHWQAATTPADLDKAIDYARRAGDRALHSLAPNEAIRWYEQALGLLATGTDDASRTCELMLALGVAQRHVADPRFRETLLTAAHQARATGHTAVLLEAAIANTRFGVAGILDEERIAVLRSALEFVAADDLPSRAMLLGNLAIELMFSVDRTAVHDVCDAAVETARHCGEPRVLAHVVAGVTLSQIGSPERSAALWDLVSEADLLAFETGDPIGEFYLAHAKAQAALGRAEMDAYRDAHERMAALAEEVGHPTLRWVLLSSSACAALLEGDVAAAEELAEQNLNVGVASGQPDALVLYGAVLMMTRWHQGRLHELVGMIETVADDAPELEFRVMRALARVESGDLEADALEAAEFAALARTTTWGVFTAIWAEVAVRTADRQLASAIYEATASLPDADSYVASAHFTAGSLAHALGAVATVLGQYDDAEGHFRAAESVNEHVRAPFHQARTWFEWGHMLLLRGNDGDRERALELLERARDTAQQFGCAAVERRANEAIASATRLPVPSALAAAAGRLFVGRENELARCNAAWERAREGHRQVVLVAGEPGIGKTTLAATLARSAHEQGATVLLGTCEEDLGVPYQPFAEALRSFVDACPAAMLTDHLRTYGGDLTRLVPEIRGRISEVPEPLKAEAESERYRLFEAAAGLLSAASAAQPLVLVLDDLQWATKATLLLLRHLVRELENQRVLIVGLYRDTEVAGDLSATLADLRRVTDVERLNLGGLDVGGVTAVLEASSTTPLDEHGHALALRLHAESDGSPFFVNEVVRHLVDSGAGFSGDHYELPASIREVLARRLAHFDEATRRLLTVAAVIGPTFPANVLELVESDDADAVLDCLEAAMSAGILRETGEPGRYAFTHALIRQALYDDISSLRRARLHRRVAEAMESLPNTDAKVAELATHFLAAAADGVADKAVDFALRAAVRAIEHIAYEEAVSFCEQALDVLQWADLDQTYVACDVVMVLADAQWRAGDVVPSRVTYKRALEIARTLGDAERFGRAALRHQSDLGVYANALSVDPDMVSALKEALVLIGSDDTPLRARLLARLVVELASPATRALEGLDGVEERQELMKEASAIAGRLGDPAVDLYVSLCRAWSAHETDPNVRRRDVQHLIELATQLGDLEAEYQARYAWNLTLLELGEIAAADAEAEHGAVIAAELRMPGSLPWTASHQALRAWLRGDLLEARRLNEAGLAEALRTHADPDVVFSNFGSQALVFAYLRSEMNGAASSVEDLRNAANDRRSKSVYSVALALIHGMFGAQAPARAELDQALGYGALDEGLFTLDERNRRFMLAMVCGYLRDVPLAAELYEQLRRFSGWWVVSVGFTFGPADRILGVLAHVLGRHDTAERHLQAAIEQAAAVPAPIFHAEASCDYAELLLDRGHPGDHQRARQLLTDCIETSQRLELDLLEARAHRLEERITDN
jgi:predicted ATPase/DNA-binding SARP family transcriptional activator